jgi:hypothetical protein
MNMRKMRMLVVVGTVTMSLGAAAPAIAVKKAISLYSEGVSIGNTAVESKLSLTFTIPYSKSTVTCTDKLSGVVEGAGSRTVTVRHKPSEPYGPATCSGGSLEISQDVSDLFGTGKANQGFSGELFVGGCALAVKKPAKGTVALNTTAIEKVSGKLNKATPEQPQACEKGATWSAEVTFNLPGSEALLEDKVS